MKRKAFLPGMIIIGLCGMLSGCRMTALPGRESFGEQIYSDDRAQTVYKDIGAAMEQTAYSDWSGYSITLDEGTVDHDFYRTEEYSVAWHSGAGREYLWYQGRLYYMDKETIAYRDMDWEELQSDDYAVRQWGLVHELLMQEPEKLEYKYIPMASDNQYLLTAEYPETEWDNQTRQFPKLSFRMDEDKNFSGCSLRWQEGMRRVLDVCCFPYENSTDLQAERKVWSFAHDLGLLEDGVPAISTQMDQREWCRSVIDSIDFDSLLDRAEYREDLTFPVLP